MLMILFMGKDLIEAFFCFLSYNANRELELRRASR